MKTSSMTLVAGLWLCSCSTSVLAADTTAPLMAALATVDQLSPHAASLNRIAAIDASAIKGYGILRDGKLVGKAGGTRVSNSGLQPAFPLHSTASAETGLLLVNGSKLPDRAANR